MTFASHSTFVRNLAWCTLLSASIFCAVRLFQASAGSNFAEPRKVEQLSDQHWNVAIAALDQNDATPAIEFVRQSLGKPGVKSQRALLQGRMLLDSGKLLAAGQAFREAAESPEWHSRANFWLGATAYKGGNTAAAENYWMMAIDADPNNLDAHRSLAMFYYDVGAIDHAVDHLQTSTKLNADDARPYRLLGLIFSDYERYEDAVGYYRSALERKLAAPVRDEVIRELTGCYLKLREYKTGLEVIEKAEDTLDAMVLKAECLVGLGEQVQAIELLELALAKDAKHFGGLMSMGDAKLLEGHASEAVAFFRRAVEVNEKDYLANYKLAQALRGAGLSEEAQTVANNAEAIKVTRERFAQLHKDATSSPRDAEIRYQLGVTAEELGMVEMAAVWFKAAIQLNPAHAAARSKLHL